MTTSTASPSPSPSQRSALAGLVCLAALWAAGPALAQTPAQTPAPGAGASAPAAAPKPGPKLLSPAETRDSASMPGEFRPEQPAKPQINIPLGKTAVAPVAPASGRPAAGQPGTKAGINDAVARCEAQADERLRASCREALAKQAPSR